MAMENTLAYLCYGNNYGNEKFYNTGNRVSISNPMFLVIILTYSYIFITSNSIIKRLHWQKSNKNIFEKSFFHFQQLGLKSGRHNT
jgi:hypothetical protein